MTAWQQEWFGTEDSYVKYLYKHIQRNQKINYHISEKVIDIHGGSRIFQGEHQPIIWQNFVKNCMKRKKFDQQGRCASLALLDSPLNLQKKDGYLNYIPEISQSDRMSKMCINESLFAFQRCAYRSEDVHTHLKGFSPPSLKARNSS